MPGATDNTFTPIHNPYIVGNPIKDSKMFFGREEDFAYVKSKLTGSERGGLVVLSGARRSGKTSILFQILQGRLGDEFMPVLIDMQSMTIGNDADFLGKVMRAIVTAGVAPTLSPIEHAVVDTADDPFTAFENFVLRTSSKLEGRKLVLAFDEYELFETNIDSGILSDRVLQVLSGLIEHHEVFVVFTGSDTLEERNRPYWDIFLSKAQQKRISFLHRRDTLRLITQPVEGVIEYDDAVPAGVADLTAGQPFYTQVLCRTLVDRMNDERRRRVSGDDVEAVVREVVENPLPQMIFHWNALSDVDRLALSIIAEIDRAEATWVGASDIEEFAAREKIGFAFEAGALNKSLESLFHGDLLAKESERDAYRFKMGLWQKWVTRMHSVWQTIDEIDQAGGPAEGGGLVRVVRRRRRTFVAALAGVVVVAAAVIVTQMAGRGDERARGGAGVAAVDSATLTVATTPTQATIFVDGSALDVSPFTRRVPAGSLLVAASLPRFQREERLVVLARDEMRPLAFTLEPMTGGLRITSEPAGADIDVDGAGTGLRTPAVVEGLSAVDPHDVALRLSDFQPGVYPSVRVYEDSVAVLHHDFRKRSAVVAVNTAPAGASVAIDGADAGASPLTLPGVAYGSHHLAVHLEGYADTTVVLDIARPDVGIMVTLRKLPPGTVVVQIPLGGDIAVDGSVVKERVEFARLSLDAGSHTIAVTNRAGQTRSETVAVESGKTTTVRFEFE
jgi:hypothetical protein